MAKANGQSPATCQACGRIITGKIFRFSNVPSSAFCSFDCQLKQTHIEVVELKLQPITEPLPPDPVYQGPTASRLHDDRFCDCAVYYENQITVPKRHSLICFCPKCGCVTQD
jgi:hypothetical protein